MSARDEVVEVLGELLPEDIKVEKYAREVDPPRKPLIMVRLDEVLPLPAAGAGQREFRMALVILASRKEAGKADDELEETLDIVLWKIDRDLQRITWTSAKRATYKQSDANEYPAFEVALSVIPTIEDTNP